MERTIGLLIYDDVEELDFVGPLEVFGMASRGRDARVVTVAERPDPVTAVNGLRVVPDCSFDDASELDLVLVPGGIGTRKQVENPVLIDWLRKVTPRCEWITSVCTGVLLLHEAGPARGKHVTTHWTFIEELGCQQPDGLRRLSGQ